MNEGHYAYLFLLALIGHLMGDFGLQPKRWALHKADKGPEGALYCLLHVGVYSLVVSSLLPVPLPWTAGHVLLIYASIYVPHWIIDRWSLASHWLRLIGGRTFDTVIRSPDGFSFSHPDDLRRDFDVAFTSIVYAVTDGMWHLICLWIVVRWLL